MKHQRYFRMNEIFASKYEEDSFLTKIDEEYNNLNDNEKNNNETYFDSNFCTSSVRL